ncbi:MAG TPA: sigma 54-interacting transcriptional regulator [Polyangiaceae bacterium]|jgi:PAS domain S-box-containing protein|nr:MAG: Transcriptional regulatory protein ZraR [Deltaproteobacteria bacterium ADurb.Bin207]HNS98635.1 sigma 54-interacting transcriptional regulator [Polyangiaceae bacterium]HNZ21632.1 sigma 54-interacting transcriptional regulator [Polyangiaceae bacterium]HOD25064.1 sigma 54-interacting transcriptional regulator [Polyangiaceae bacterium]HOE48589.1 sigma 54-interacting transcriptional regulator [Polyangiaceae bacterium]
MKPPVDALYPLILDNIGEGVFSVDEDFHITSFNTEAERITGISRDQAIGRKCYEVFRASICQTGCALAETVRSGKPIRNVRIDVLDANMDVVPICVSTAVLRDEQGRLLGGVEIFRDISDVEALRSEVTGQKGFRDIIGTSVPMRRIFAMLPDVAASDAPVLVTGASGTGKELVARAIHDLSRRHKGPFNQINCGALPDTLLESELFGYEKGAFTDARKSKPGRFVLADGGTLFLDEVGELSAAFQVKLLRALQEGEVQPLGSTRTIRVDVRVVAATNRDLARAVGERTFREDLFYRLRVIPIEIPPLAARPKDIPLLVDHFVKETARRTGKRIEGVTAPALQALCRYDYPGNVRELKNIVERAFVFCREPRIDLSHLPEEVLVRETRESVPPSDEVGLEESPTTQEVETLRKALEKHRWNRTATAKALGIGRNTLWRKMTKYGLLEVADTVPEP